MESVLTYTLLADGPSDEAITRVIDWLVKDVAPSLTPLPQFADLRGLPRPPKMLHQQIETALRLHPCDILFIHRDAENQSPSARRAEIQSAVNQVSPVGEHIPVVPVRMTEAWLLSDERAIRGASGNPNGIARLQLPAIARLEELADPKQSLRELLSQAAAIATRLPYRQRELATAATTKRVANLTGSFAALSGVPAFALLRDDIAASLAVLHADR